MLGEKTGCLWEGGEGAWKGYEGTFWGDGSSLCLDGGLGSLGVYVCLNLANIPFILVDFMWKI